MNNSRSEGSDYPTQITYFTTSFGPNDEAVTEKGRGEPVRYTFPLQLKLPESLHPVKCVM